MKHSFLLSQHVGARNSSKKMMSFTPNRDQTPNPIPQNKLVWKFIIEGARVTLQPNTPKSGIYGTLLQKFGFLSSPKTTQ